MITFEGVRLKSQTSKEKAPPDEDLELLMEIIKSLRRLMMESSTASITETPV